MDMELNNIISDINNIISDINNIISGDIIYPS